MYQKAKRIILIILVIVLIIGALLYFVPWPTRIDLTLDAAKLDSNGNAVGQVSIAIEGWRLDYLFQADQLNVDIQPFDHFNWIKLTRDANVNKEGIINQYFQDCKSIYCYTSHSSFCQLVFTADFKYVAFIDDTYDAKTYYVASADNQIGYEELSEYFRYLPPFG